MNLTEFKNLKILIVDDEPANLRVLYNLLKDYPFQIFTLQNSSMVLEFIEKEYPDLILLDIMMPGINGFELCKQIKSKEEFKRISIIFISALNDVQNVVKGFELGAVDYIPKPFQSEEVLARIRNQLTIQFQARKLEEKNKELAELNSMKNKFFSIIAHDVKNPFTSILGISELLYEDFETYDRQRLKEMVKNIYFSSKQCFNLLENLLRWANSQLNNVVVQPDKHNLLKQVQSILDIMQVQVERKQIEISYSIDSSLFYYADKNIVDTVLRNLISNAIKFTPKNGKVEISAEQVLDKIKIRVSDTGIGIPKEIQEKLFSVGFQVTRKGTEKEIGTGLGLLVSYEFVKKSNGKLYFESEVGKGTSFFIELPTQA